MAERLELAPEVFVHVGGRADQFVLGPDQACVSRWLRRLRPATPPSDPT
jgi:hypothetical protein